MPIYEYGCHRCLTFSEENVSIANRDDVRDCEICGGVKYRKISFKGSVWAPTANGGMK